MERPLTYRISHPTKTIHGSIRLSSSKSITNRLLIIKQAGRLDLNILNPSTSKDTRALSEALATIDQQTHFDIGHAGTAMRFLTALFALTPGERLLTGSPRMKERPIGELVNVLRQLGADISYLEKDGFPPLLIKGKKLNGGKIRINGSISSQYISALLMIAPLLDHDLEIGLTGKVVSWPYIQMTVGLMQEFGADVSWSDSHISCRKKNYFSTRDSYTVEGDWSSASYLYSLLALSKPGSELIIEGLHQKSLQADVCWPLFMQFGVENTFTGAGVKLRKLPASTTSDHKTFHFDFSNSPDIAQTLAVTAAAFGMNGLFSGLSTLKIKETDRILALHKELQKAGVHTTIGDEWIQFNGDTPKAVQDASFNTYQDHRMAMAFAPLALVMDHVDIEDPEVVEKSYPEFWDHLRQLGFRIETLFSS